MKNIVNRNSIGQYHGYQEWYTTIDKILQLRGTYQKSEPINYEEWHAVEETRYYII